MRHSPSIILVASVLTIGGVLVPQLATAQAPETPAPPAAQPATPEQQPPAAQPAAPAAELPGPYRPVAIKLPTIMTDPAFEAFRKNLQGIAQKKDRNALARLIAKDFFWIPEDTDVADKRRSGIENLAKAIGLEGANAHGWDELALYAAEPTTMNDPQRKGVVCAPGEPEFDEKAADELAEKTQTEASDWGYPAKDGVEVHEAANATSPVVEKLGLHLVRVLPDDSPANVVNASHIKVLTPSGKPGFVANDMILPLISEQMCYVKEGNAWKIAGYIGGAHSR